MQTQYLLAIHSTDLGKYGIQREADLWVEDWSGLQNEFRTSKTKKRNPLLGKKMAKLTKNSTG